MTTPPPYGFPPTCSSLHPSSSSGSSCQNRNAPRTPTPPPRVRHTDDHGVVHVRMRLHRAFDFVGEDLLSSGVDANSAAAEHRDRPIGLDGREVARHRPSLTLDLDERLGGLLRVVVV